MKLILSISRNIGNSDKVKAYLSQLSEEHSEQKTWVNSVLKNYLLKVHEDLKLWDSSAVYFTGTTQTAIVATADHVLVKLNLVCRMIR